MHQSVERKRKTVSNRLASLIFLAGITLMALPAKTARAGEDPWAGMARVLKQIVEPEIPESVYDIVAFGASGDGITDARPAIQAAIRKANTYGGGVILLSDGEWLCKGPIHLKSNVFLKISEEAKLIFSENPSDYLPQVRTRWEGTDCYNYSPLIYAAYSVNVGLIGGGEIDGKGGAIFSGWRTRQKDAQDRLRQMGREGVSLHARVFGESDYLRPSMIQFYSCQNVLVDGVKITDSPMWVVHPVYSNNVIIRNIEVVSDRLNNDGVDIDSCVNVLVEHNKFSTQDDGIVIKSGRDQDGWRVGRPSEQVVIRNNYIEGHNGIAIGSEISGGVRNVFIENNQMGDVRSALYFKSNRDRGGVVERIRIRNIEVKQANNLIRFNTDYHSYAGGDSPSIFRNFLIEEVHCKTVSDTAIFAKGFAESPIRDITIKNVTVKDAAHDLQLNHTKNFVLKNVIIEGINITTTALSEVSARGECIPCF